jgi:hypothetical protein
MAKIQVTPNRDDLPPHPIDGKLPPGGGLWTADQYTFRLIRDGDITEVAEAPPDEGGAKHAPPEHDPPDHKRKSK